MLLNCSVGEVSWKSLVLQEDSTSLSWWKSVLNIYWKDWCWSWNFNALTTWCKDLTHLKRPWCWERLRSRGERHARGWDGWRASLTLAMSWVNFVSWWLTGTPGVLHSMGVANSQRQLSDWMRRLSFNFLECVPILLEDEHRLSCNGAHCSSVERAFSESYLASILLYGILSIPSPWGQGFYDDPKFWSWTIASRFWSPSFSNLKTTFSTLHRRQKPMLVVKWLHILNKEIHSILNRKEERRAR